MFFYANVSTCHDSTPNFKHHFWSDIYYKFSRAWTCFCNWNPKMLKESSSKTSSRPSTLSGASGVVPMAGTCCRGKRLSDENGATCDWGWDGWWAHSRSLLGWLSNANLQNSWGCFRSKPAWNVNCLDYVHPNRWSTRVDYLQCEYNLNAKDSFLEFFLLGHHPRWKDIKTYQNHNSMMDFVAVFWSPLPCQVASNKICFEHIFRFSEFAHPAAHPRMGDPEGGGGGWGASTMGLAPNPWRNHGPGELLDKPLD